MIPELSSGKTSERELESGPEEIKKMETTL